ncbi:phage head closure protein [Symbiobacterium terraclitae]|uniref:phage head closure protein n=1 Tax=Symbiobacterium terraclitae TaxID=557451 RepID=UPI0035B56E83
MTTAAVFRQRVTLQQHVVGQDEYGQPIDTWQDVATVWAAVEPLRGREYFAAHQVQAEVTTRIRIRYRRGIRPEMRVLYDGRVFNILSVIDPEERHRELQLMCREVV